MEEKRSVLNTELPKAPLSEGSDATVIGDVHARLDARRRVAEQAITDLTTHTGLMFPAELPTELSVKPRVKPSDFVDPTVGE